MSSGKSRRNRSRARFSQSVGPTLFDTTTCEPSEPTTLSLSTSSAQDFPARTCLTQGEAMAWRVTVLVSGSNASGSFASFDRGTWSSKTSQLSLLEESTLYSGDWPRSGMMRGGVASALPMSALRIGASASSWSRGWWPTPLVHDAVKPQHGKMAGGFLPLSAAVRTEWPPPRASENENRQTKPTPSQLSGTHGRSLAAEANLWPTPTANEHKATGYQSRDGELRPSLRVAARMEWPTPAAADGTGGRVSTQIDATGTRPDGRRSTVTLATAIRQEWPTPTVSGNNNRAGTGEKSGDGLSVAVKQEWQTPLATDSNGSKRGRAAQGSMPLSQQVRDWPTPLAADASHKKASPELMAEGGRPLVEQISATQGGPLNPAWVSQLMGFPDGYLDVEYQPTKKPRKRSPADGQLAPDNPNTSGKRRARRTASRTEKRS